MVGGGGGGTSAAVAVPPVETAETTLPSTVSVTVHAEPPEGQEKRTPPTSSVSPAWIVTVRSPAASAVSRS